MSEQNKHHGTEEEKAESKTLFVGNLSFKTTEEDLENVFGKFGKITNVRVGRDRETRKSKGFAFVEFNERKEAEEAFGKIWLEEPFVLIMMSERIRNLEDQEAEVPLEDVVTQEVQEEEIQEVHQDEEILEVHREEEETRDHQEEEEIQDPLQDEEETQEVLLDVQEMILAHHVVEEIQDLLQDVQENQNKI